MKILKLDFISSEETGSGSDEEMTMTKIFLRYRGEVCKLIP